MITSLLKAKWALAALALALAVCGLRARFALTITWGECMAPTLAHGSLLIVDKWAFHRSAPERGDVVIARARKDLLVKRVIGLPGEQAGVREGIARVQGAVLFEPGARGGNLEIAPAQLGPRRYALVGDNRSLTTRDVVHAVVGPEQIVGKVLAAFDWRRFAFCRVQ